MALLADKVVLVSGGSQGVGAEVARAAARESAAVAVTGRRRAPSEALADLPAVDSLVVTDAVPAVTAEVAARFGCRRAGGRLDRRSLYHVPAHAPTGADGRGAHMSTTDTPAAEGTIGGAPISWGVCEVPGWGYQLRPDRVLAEMREVGLTATELGPDGFLPDEPDAMTQVLDHHGLRAVGGFTPLLLHVAGHDPVPAVERLLQGYDAAGAGVLVLSAVTGQGGYDTRPELDEAGWRTLLANLDRLTSLAAGHGVRAVLHPHVGTMVEHGAEVRRVLEGSSITCTTQ
jgi:hypothetical protein